MSLTNKFPLKFGHVTALRRIAMTYDWIPEDEKLRILEELLSDPSCPIPRDASRQFSRDVKLQLFEDLCEGGAIKFDPPRNPIPAPMPAPLPPNPAKKVISDNEIIEERFRTLPADKRNRLAEIKRAYPDVGLGQLPEDLRNEVIGIMRSHLFPKTHK
jgi:hypothetical protein